MPIFLLIQSKCSLDIKVAYQKILQLSYVDKFLDDVHLEFRDKYKKEMENGRFLGNYEFSSEYASVKQNFKILYPEPLLMIPIVRFLDALKIMAKKLRVNRKR